MPLLMTQLHDYMESVFKDEQIVSDEVIRKEGLEVVNELKKFHFVLRNHMTDKNARSIFVKIQESAERKATDNILKATHGTGTDDSMRESFVGLQQSSENKMVQHIISEKKLGKLAQSIWIIHTPTVATPCVSDGTPTPNLMTDEIMSDEKRKALTLSRANIIRDYLEAGGVLIVAYDATQVKQRNQQQLDIYEKLKLQYPKQIIDFPMQLQTTYPDEMIGATYIIQDTDSKFEMTNLGVQANATRDDATWGVWMHNRQTAVLEVTQRMCKVLSFLNTAGLNQVLANHAYKHNIDPDEFAGLLSRYINLEIDSKDGVSCRMQ